MEQIKDVVIEPVAAEIINLDPKVQEDMIKKLISDFVTIFSPLYKRTNNIFNSSRLDTLVQGSVYTKYEVEVQTSDKPPIFHRQITDLGNIVLINDINTVHGKVWVYYQGKWKEIPHSLNQSVADKVTHNDDMLYIYSTVREERYIKGTKQEVFETKIFKVNVEDLKRSNYIIIPELGMVVYLATKFNEEPVINGSFTLNKWFEGYAFEVCRQMLFWNFLNFPIIGVFIDKGLYRVFEKHNIENPVLYLRLDNFIKPIPILPYPFEYIKEDDEEADHMCYLSIIYTDNIENATFEDFISKIYRIDKLTECVKAYIAKLENNKEDKKATIFKLNLPDINFIIPNETQLYISWNKEQLKSIKLLYTNKELREEVELLRKEIEKLNNELEQKENELRAKREKIENLKNEINNLKNTILKKEEEIIKLKGELDIYKLKLGIHNEQTDKTKQELLLEREKIKTELELQKRELELEKKQLEIEREEKKVQQEAHKETKTKLDLLDKFLTKGLPMIVTILMILYYLSTRYGFAPRTFNPSILRRDMDDQEAFPYFEKLVKEFCYHGVERDPVIESMVNDFIAKWRQKFMTKNKNFNNSITDIYTGMIKNPVTTIKNIREEACQRTEKSFIENFLTGLKGIANRSILTL